MSTGFITNMIHTLSRIVSYHKVGKLENHKKKRGYSQTFLGGMLITFLWL